MYKRLFNNLVRFILYSRPFFSCLSRDADGGDWKVFCCQLLKLNLKLTTIQGNARGLLLVSVELLQSKIAIPSDLSFNLCIQLVFGCSNVYSAGMTRINMRVKQKCLKAWERCHSVDKLSAIKSNWNPAHKNAWKWALNYNPHNRWVEIFFDICAWYHWTIVRIHTHTTLSNRFRWRRIRTSQTNLLMLFFFSFLLFGIRHSSFIPFLFPFQTNILTTKMCYCSTPENSHHYKTCAVYSLDGLMNNWIT